MNCDTATHRNGFALPVALLAIMVIGAIVTGGFYASFQETRVSASVDLANQAFYVAEYGLEQALGTWKNGDLADATTTTLGPVAVTGGGSATGTYQITARRIGASLFVVTSRGTVTEGPHRATRTVGSVVRPTVAEVPYRTALAVFGGLTVGGSSRIRGDDAGGEGCAAGPDGSAVTAVDGSAVERLGSASGISGEPPIDTAPGMTAAGLSDFGGVALATLTAAASKVYPDGATEANMGPVTSSAAGDTVCHEASPRNWGEPAGTGPCGDYMPIIHAEGDFSVQAGRGQGILIVDGDLRVGGNFEFYGLVIVKGTLHTAGAGNHMEGTTLVMGHGELDSRSATTGDAVIQYSRCRVERALNASLRPRPLAARSWIDFTAIASG